MCFVEKLIFLEIIIALTIVNQYHNILFYFYLEGSHKSNIFLDTEKISVKIFYRQRTTKHNNIVLQIVITKKLINVIKKTKSIKKKTIFF